MMEQLIDAAARLATEAGATVTCTRAWNVLLLNGHLRVKIALASCRHYPDTLYRWRVPIHKGRAADFVLCALMDRLNEHVARYLLLPTCAFDQDTIFVSDQRAARHSEHSFDSLEAVFGRP